MIARQLLGEADYLRRFHRSAPLRSRVLSERLRAGGQDGKRHLLLLDNLESITGVRLAIQNTLDKAEQARLTTSSAAWPAGARSCCSAPGARSGWRTAPLATTSTRCPGWNPEAASNHLADLILQRYKVTKWRSDKDFTRLLKLLEGYPLPLEIVLANLQRQTPAEIVRGVGGRARGNRHQQAQPDREPARLHRLLLWQPGRGQPPAAATAWRRSPG